jgi:hypothetical protein
MASRTALSVRGNPPILGGVDDPAMTANNIQTKRGERRAAPHVQIKIVK